MKTKTRGGRARVPNFASPNRISTTESLRFFNHESIITKDEANGENGICRMALGTSSKMNDDVDIASACSDDETDIPAENHSGLGPSGDCMDVDSLEEEPCIKCNRRDGNLLVCSQSGCPISVHENCMNCGLKFDDVGNFYCPYCWYKHELVRMKVLRKKAMETKKQLACFLDTKRVGGDKENRRSDEGKELNMSSLGGKSNYGDGDSEDRMDSDQNGNRSVEAEEELENDGVNPKRADSFEQFNPLAPLFHTGDKINFSQEKTSRVESLVNSTSIERPNEKNVSETHELDVLEDGETIHMEDLGQVDNSGHEKIFEDQLQEEPHSACSVEEENAVYCLLNLSKEDKLDPVKLKEGRREDEEKIAPRTLGTEISGSDIEPISMRLRSVAGSSKKAQSRSVNSKKKFSSSKGANLEKAKSQNVESLKKLSSPKGANPEQAKNQNVDSSKKLSSPKEANPEKSKSQNVDSSKKSSSPKGANPEKAKSQNVDSSKKLTAPKGANPEKIARAHLARNEIATASKNSTQVSGEKFTNFTFASEKRRRLHWTAEEEEMLKEGVQKFSTKKKKIFLGGKFWNSVIMFLILLVLHLILRINGETLWPKSPKESTGGNLGHVGLKMKKTLQRS